MQERVPKHLRRFVQKDHERLGLYKKLLAQGVSKEEIFRRVSGGLGQGKFHGSGEKEGRLGRGGTKRRSPKK